MSSLLLYVTIHLPMFYKVSTNKTPYPPISLSDQATPWCNCATHSCFQSQSDSRVSIVHPSVHPFVCLFVRSFVWNTSLNIKTLSSIDFFINPLYHQSTLSSIDFIINPLYHQSTLSSIDFIINPLYHQSTLSSIDFNHQLTLIIKWHQSSIVFNHHSSLWL